MWFFETGVTHLLGRKTDAKLVLPKHDILSCNCKKSISKVSYPNFQANDKPSQATHNSTIKLEVIPILRDKPNVKWWFSNMYFVGFYSVPNLIVILFNLMYPVFVVGIYC